MKTTTFKSVFDDAVATRNCLLETRARLLRIARSTLHNATDELLKLGLTAPNPHHVDRLRPHELNVTALGLNKAKEQELVAKLNLLETRWCYGYVTFLLFRRKLDESRLPIMRGFAILDDKKAFKNAIFTAARDRTSDHLMNISFQILKPECQEDFGTCFDFCQDEGNKLLSAVKIESMNRYINQSIVDSVGFLISDTL